MNVFDKRQSQIGNGRSEEERRVIRKRIQEQQNPTVGSALCLLVSFGSLAGVFVWFTWFNPDSHNCYYLEGNAYGDISRHFFTDDQWAQKVDVTHKFRIWCFAGLILCSIVLLYSLMGFIYYCTARDIHGKLANCFLTMGYCLAVVWLVFGSVSRFGPAGVTCSGQEWSPPAYINFDNPMTYSPYLLKTGNLIATLLVLMYCFYGCLCCCGCCAFMAVACGYRRELS